MSISLSDIRVPVFVKHLLPSLIFVAKASCVSPLHCYILIISHRVGHLQEFTVWSHICNCAEAYILGLREIIRGNHTLGGAPFSVSLRVLSTMCACKY